MRNQSLVRMRPGLRMALLPAAVIGLALLALLAGTPTASAQTPG